MTALRQSWWNLWSIKVRNLKFTSQHTIFNRISNKESLMHQFKMQIQTQNSILRIKNILKRTKLFLKRPTSPWLTYWVMWHPRTLKTFRVSYQSTSLNMSNPSSVSSIIYQLISKYPQCSIKFKPSSQNWISSRTCMRRRLLQR